MQHFNLLHQRPHFIIKNQSERPQIANTCQTIMINVANVVNQVILIMQSDFDMHNDKCCKSSDPNNAKWL